MPINRFYDHLVEEEKLQEYMELLVSAFNPKACQGIMCRDYLSIKWDGTIYDCDFNQQIELPMRKPPQVATENRLSVFDITCTDDLLNTSMSTASHCFGCTAGAGSSCQGATS